MTQDNVKPRPLPPRIPDALPELERAIVLLGSMVKSGLGNKAKEELTQLVGTLPSPQEAMPWKTALSRLRKERVEAKTTDSKE